MTETPTTTCTVTTGGLRTLLATVARFAGTDDTLPMIKSVMLHTAMHRQVPQLVATATDRFVLGQMHIEATGALPGDKLVPLDEVKRALAMLKLADPLSLIELSVVDDGLRLAGNRMTITLELRDDSFPKVGKLFDTPKPTEPVGEVAFNGPFLAKFSAVAKEISEGMPGRHSMRVEHSSKTRPAFITIGDCFRGLIMPMRMPDEGMPEVPFFISATEQALLDDATAERAEAEQKAKRSAAAKKAAATRRANAAGKPAGRSGKAAA
ncbi:MAG TPA: hypothetical protein VFV67_33935 [Actinophytocola sp.]|uniref:hypothetical protein n=1 Tax=Actinophytocola sp. TaxID=1872138 RepID=UPI002DB7ECDF|nr:hypothetical protein [Actinophytocola sp.]HEU5475668.1 hypothetical protein [Actinophytocola sp.]